MFALADLLALLSGAAVGFILSLIGGGGSILATPALLYIVGVADAHAAIGTSAMAVSVNAFVNLIPHARRGHVQWRCAGIFAAAGVLGAAMGAAVGKLTDSRMLLPLFAGVMITVALSVLRRKDAGGTEKVVVTRRIVLQLVVTGFVVGLLAGFFGIGGGFLIVPGLMQSSGMSMLSAVGSSLFAVGAFGLTTAISYAMSGLVDWSVAAEFIVGGVGGGMLGAYLAARLAPLPGVLPKVFAAVVFATAIYMFIRSVLLH